MKYRTNETVTVITAKYKEVPVGTIAIVRAFYDGNYAVSIENIHNPRSTHDYFYFDENQLKGGTTVKNNRMEGNYRIALVRFLDGTNTEREYEYACYDYTIEEMDHCVVMSAHHGIGVAQVIKLIPKDDRVISREIICKADFTDYNIRCDKRRAKAELEKKMKQRAAELQELSLYKMLAEHDPSMKELLSAYESVEAL